MRADGVPSATTPAGCAASPVLGWPPTRPPAPRASVAHLVQRCARWARYQPPAWAASSRICSSTVSSSEHLHDGTAPGLAELGLRHGKAPAHAQIRCARDALTSLLLRHDSTSSTAIVARAGEQVAERLGHGYAPRPSSISSSELAARRLRRALSPPAERAELVGRHLLRSSLHLAVEQRLPSAVLGDQHFTRARYGDSEMRDSCLMCRFTPHGLRRRWTGSR